MRVGGAVAWSETLHVYSGIVHYHWDVGKTSNIRLKKNHIELPLETPWLLLGTLPSDVENNGHASLLRILPLIPKKMITASRLRQRHLLQ